MTQPRSRVDLYAAIRRDARSGMSNRALQRKHGVGFRTVTAALESAWPKERKQSSKRGSRLDAYRVVIDDWLRSDVDAPRKQRHTAKRIFDRLLDEHDRAGVVSYWIVREYVATRRREIRVEVGGEPANAFIPQKHLPGREAEVDFGDVAIRLRGELVTCALFSLRLSYSGKAVHRVSASGAGSLFEGHVHAFNVLGGVPTGKIRYDNLKAAVASVIGFSPASGSRPTGGPPSVPTTASKPSIASPESKVRTRRAASRGRSAGSDATTSSLSPRSTP